MRKVMRSRSWSDYCRERVMSYKRQIESPAGNACIEWAVRNLANSYRPNIFKYRTAKMLGRMYRAGKIKNDPERSRVFLSVMKEAN